MKRNKKNFCVLCGADITIKRLRFAKYCKGCARDMEYKRSIESRKKFKKQLQIKRTKEAILYLRKRKIITTKEYKKILNNFSKKEDPIYK